MPQVKKANLQHIHIHIHTEKSKPKPKSKPKSKNLRDKSNFRNRRGKKVYLTKILEVIYPLMR